MLIVREGDRIVQEHHPLIRNNRYKAFAYSPDTFPPASPPLIGPGAAVPRPRVAPVAAVPSQSSNVPLPPSRPRVGGAAMRHAPARPGRREAEYFAPPKPLGSELLRKRFVEQWRR